MIKNKIKIKKFSIFLTTIKIVKTLFKNYLKIQVH